LANWAIVAIPDEDDYVWKLSSEKVPHMTLLFLGDQNDDAAIPALTSFIGHVVENSLHRFGLSVDHRGVLGPKDADVLFFSAEPGELKGHSLKMLADVRSALLQNETIFKDHAPEALAYPEWTPHLTMGYPTAPAKEDDRDYPGLKWINFNKIAFWTDDYSGTEFLLKDQWADMAMSDLDEEDPNSLQHYGVLGMKWGKHLRSGGSDSKASHKLPSSSDHSVSRELAKRPTRTLSNSELETIRKRLQLEQNVSQLKTKQSTVNRGHEAAKAALAIGTTAASLYALSQTPAGKAAVAAGKKLLSRE